MMNTPDTEAAIERVQSGEVEAYEVVVQAYCRPLRTWLSALAPGELDPDEITQIALVEAYRNIGRYRLGSDFGAWLRSIARNSLLSELRRDRRERARRRSYIQEIEFDASRDELEREERGDKAHALRGCLDRLPADAKEMIRLRYDGSEDLKSIAESLGTSLSAVKFKLHWLRTKLRDCIRSRLAEGAV